MYVVVRHYTSFSYIGLNVIWGFKSSDTAIGFHWNLLYLIERLTD
jgi:hypothetical protein